MRAQHIAHELSKKPDVPLAAGYTRHTAEREFKAQIEVALPIGLLVVRWERIWRMDKPYHAPPFPFADRLKEINPELSIHWIGRLKRWGVCRMHKAYDVIKYNGVYLKIFDKYPILLYVIEGAHKEFMMPDERWLPKRDIRKEDVYEKMIRMNEADDRKAAKDEEVTDDIWNDTIKESRNEVEEYITGSKPKITVSINGTKEQENG